MHTFLLRAEGVNLDNFIYDTQDLSTIRGGGLMLLNAAEEVTRALEARGARFTALIEGASIGLYHVESDEAPEDVRKAVEKTLGREMPHATFVVDVAESGSDGPDARERLETRNRWRQMQAPSVVYPALKNAGGVCEVDLVRPAAVQKILRGGKRWISAATDDRREHGKKAKQKFYRDEIARVSPASGKLDFDFAHDFEDIYGDSGNWGNLKDKLALIYLDGNKFGSRSAKCPGRKELWAFSNGLRNKHAAILAKLIERIPLDKGWQTFDSGNAMSARLETLLWGGDEIIWVVPAWKGWELLRLFFEECEAHSNPEWNPTRDQPLTYKAVLVFCHGKTPIHSVLALAHQLADVIKDDLGDRQENKVLYQVLESFDHVEKPSADMVLPAQALKTIEGAMPLWREHISNKKLHKIQRLAGEEAQKLEEEIRKDLQNACPAALKPLDETGAKVWTHIVELRDYVKPEGGEA